MGEGRRGEIIVEGTICIRPSCAMGGRFGYGKSNRKLEPASVQAWSRKGGRKKGVPRQTGFPLKATASMCPIDTSPTFLLVSIIYIPIPSIFNEIIAIV